MRPTYAVASESVTHPQSKALGTLHRKPVRPVPTGVIHAFDDTSDETLCGLALSELHRFEGRSFADTGGDLCGTCQAESF